MDIKIKKIIRLKHIQRNRNSKIYILETINKEMNFTGKNILEIIKKNYENIIILRKKDHTGLQKRQDSEWTIIIFVAKYSHLRIVIFLHIIADFSDEIKSHHLKQHFNKFQLFLLNYFLFFIFSFS